MGALTEKSGDSDWTLILYTAPWCKACKVMEPVMDEIAAEWRGRISVVSVDVDKKPEAASRRGIRSLPTLILAQGDIERVRILGARNKRGLSKILGEHVGA